MTTFRAWDKKTKSWFYFHVGQIINGESEELKTYNRLCMNGVYWYKKTYEKDKEKKDIFESDIVSLTWFFRESGARAKGLIIYKDFGFYVRLLSEAHSNACIFGKGQEIPLNHYETTVEKNIGNIYENEDKFNNIIK